MSDQNHLIRNFLRTKEKSPLKVVHFFDIKFKSKDIMKEDKFKIDIENIDKKKCMKNADKKLKEYFNDKKQFFIICEGEYIKDKIIKMLKLYECFYVELTKKKMKLKRNWKKKQKLIIIKSYLYMLYIKHILKLKN